MRTRTTLLLVLCTLLVSAVPAGVAGAAAAPGATTTHAGVSSDATLQQEVPDCSYPFSSTDATGEEVTVEEAPETVTTLGPSAAQTMWEIGGKEQVVGLDANAYYLADAESRTNVSASGFGYSTEAVVGTEADLVLAANIVSNDTVTALRDAGMTVYKFEEATSVEDVADKTALIGQLTDNCEGAAEANAWMNANVETANEVTADADRPRVIVPLGGGFVVGGETFIDAIVTAAGGENVAAEEYGSGYAEASDEVIIELDPEVVVIQAWMSGLLEEEPYASTTAGENNASVVVDSNYLSQPAPRSVVYTTQNLTEAFHPDAAASAEWTARSDVDVEVETETETTTETTETTEATQTTVTEETATTVTPETHTTSEAPGFGGVAAVAALGAGAALLARRD